MSSSKSDSKLFSRVSLSQLSFEDREPIFLAQVEQSESDERPLATLVLDLAAKTSANCMMLETDDYATQNKASELRDELHKAQDRKDKNNVAVKEFLKKVVANMTMNNNEMVGLASEIIAVMKINDAEVKKMLVQHDLSPSLHD